MCSSPLYCAPFDRAGIAQFGYDSVVAELNPATSEIAGSGASSADRPKLRPVEAFPLAGGEDEYVVRDASMLSGAQLSVSRGALVLMSFMDGSRTRAEILQTLHEATGQTIAADTLDQVITHLTEALLLEGEPFEAFYAELVSDYRASGVREMPTAAQLGIEDASGSIFQEILAKAQTPPIERTARGIVAPHLDYPRGAPCYADAYAALVNRPPPKRVVVLGTNHFGRSMSVVATGNDFETPLGRTTVDREFIERLERSTGPLREFEYDHLREHSVELQVAFLQHIFGADAFTLVPVLCPDPCGPTGTKPIDGRGVDLADFAVALREAIESDDADTLLVAGADLSHVGREFGDDLELDEPLLAQIETHDRTALAKLVGESPAAFVEALAACGNATRVCSAGCIYALATALGDATPTLLRYHQAVTAEAGTCVTCAAVLYA